MEAWKKATYEEQIAFVNEFVKLQSEKLCKHLRIVNRCLLKNGE